MTYEFALAAAWPAVTQVARAELRRFRLQAEVVDDLVQDAAAVVMRRRPAFSTSDDLAPYVRIVVRRLALRWIQKATKEVVGAVPDTAGTVSVPELAEYRLRLRGTAKAFAALAPDQKAHLRAYLGDAERVGDARERARERKRIERIRLAMTRVAEGMAAALGWARDRLRWIEAVGPHIAGVACAVTGLMAVFLPDMSLAPAQAQAVVASSAGSVAPRVAELPVPAAAQSVASVAVPATGGARAPTTSPKGGSEIIVVEDPMGGRTRVRATDNPDAALACVLSSCVRYSDVPVELPGDPRK